MNDMRDPYPGASPAADALIGAAVPASELRTSPTIGAVVGALAKAQMEFEVLRKLHRADAGKRSYQYATLDDVFAATRPALLNNNLCLFQPVVHVAPHALLLTRLVHTESGEWLESSVRLTQAGSANPQDFGSELTYKRRYAITALIGFEASDDDGKRARDAAEEAAKQRAAEGQGPAAGKRPAPPSGSMREHAQSVTGRTPLAPNGETFTLVNSIGDEVTVTDNPKTGAAAIVVYEKTWETWIERFKTANEVSARWTANRPFLTAARVKHGPVVDRIERALAERREQLPLEPSQPGAPATH